MCLLKNRKGFTLVEILVVIAMIGILASVIYPKLTSQMDKPKKSKAVIEIKSMKNAMDVYFAENNEYPTDEDDVINLMRENGVLNGKFGDIGTVDPWGNPYYIKITATTYTIWSEGPKTSDDEIDDIYTDQDTIDITVNTTNLQTNSATTYSTDTGSGT